MVLHTVRHNVRILQATPEALRRELGRVRISPDQVATLIERSLGHLVILEKVDPPSRELMQVAISVCGGELVPCQTDSVPATLAQDVILLGSRGALWHVAQTIQEDPRAGKLCLAGELSQALAHVLGETDRGRCTIGATTLVWGTRTYIMGIVNATPDSFSGDGTRGASRSPEQHTEAAVSQALRFLEQGADIIDIGGESTRPGGTPIDEKEELARIIPAITALSSQTTAPISVDTFKANVARAALDAGAHLVNDVWGLQMDPEMAKLVAERQAPVIIMHNRSRPKDARQEAQLGGRYVGVAYPDLLADITRELRAQVALAELWGITRERIIIDPGIGFGKTVEQNLALINRLDELRVLGLPLLLGPSRKSFIGYTLDLPPGQRVEGTAAAVAIAIARGADIVRVHDVQQMVRVARMVDAITKAG